MHESEAEYQGVPLIYKLIDLKALSLSLEALGDLVAWAEDSGFAGLNITHPCKQTATAFVDTLSEDAAAVGAINTIVFENGRRIGQNTDCFGFAQSFQEDMVGVAPGKVVLLGAGGAGSAVGHALMRCGVKSLAIHDIDRARTERLAGQLVRRFGPGTARAVSDVSEALSVCDGLVNATPIGTDDHPGIPVDPALLRPELWVADIIYFKSETELLSCARQIGCRTMSGKGMAVYQAARAFELFTGRKPDVARMRSCFDAAGAVRPIDRA